MVSDVEHLFIRSFFFLSLSCNMSFGGDANTEGHILAFQSKNIFVENHFDVLNWGMTPMMGETHKTEFGHYPKERIWHQ